MPAHLPVCLLPPAMLATWWAGTQHVLDRKVCRNVPSCEERCPSPYCSLQPSSLNEYSLAYIFSLYCGLASWDLSQILSVEEASSFLGLDQFVAITAHAFFHHFTKYLLRMGFKAAIVSPCILASSSSSSASTSFTFPIPKRH